MSKRRNIHPRSPRKPNAPAWDYLQMDGGWLTAEGIAMEVGMLPETVDRSMWRWHQHGHVETRRVELAFVGGFTRSGRNRSNLETRREWRTL